MYRIATHSISQTFLALRATLVIARRFLLLAAKTLCRDAVFRLATCRSANVDRFAADARIWPRVDACFSAFAAVLAQTRFLADRTAKPNLRVEAGFFRQAACHRSTTDWTARCSCRVACAHTTEVYDSTGSHTDDFADCVVNQRRSTTARHACDASRSVG